MWTGRGRYDDGSPWLDVVTGSGSRLSGGELGARKPNEDLAEICLLLTSLEELWSCAGG